MVEKTLAMKVLEGKKIPFESFPYNSENRDAELIAGEIGVPANQVFKTLVVERVSGKTLLVMIPANRLLDLKKLAKVIDEKKLKMASQKEAEEMTGLQVGGISALALLNRGFDMYLDESARDLDEIFVSGGKRGVQIKIKVSDLISVTRARIVESSR